jgi:hypothetical protein
MRLERVHLPDIHGVQEPARGCDLKSEKRHGASTAQQGGKPQSAGHIDQQPAEHQGNPVRDGAQLDQHGREQEERTQRRATPGEPVRSSFEALGEHHHCAQQPQGRHQPVDPEQHEPDGEVDG